MSSLPPVARAPQAGHAHGPPAFNWLKAGRLCGAVLVFGLLSAALVDFRELLPVALGHRLASVQFVPALLATLGGALFPLAAFAALLVLTLFLGRVYCSVLCPLGIFQDLVFRLGRLTRLRRRSLPFVREARWVRHAFVWASVLFALVGWGTFALTLLDPYSNYGRFASALFRPVLVWANNHVVFIGEYFGWSFLYRVDLPFPGLGALLFPALVLTVLIVLAALRGRLWCNSVCPVGTLLGWISRHAAFRISIDPGSCTKCAHCLRACKAQCIDLRKGAVDFSRCVACYNCIGVCDEKGIRYRWSWGRASVPSHKAPSKPLSPEPSDSTVVDPARRRLLRDTAQGLVLGTGLACLASKAPAAEATGLATQGAASGAGTPPAPTPFFTLSGLTPVCPPGARGISRFLDRCTACQLCVSACPKHVLQPALFEYGLKGFLKPRLDFTASFCDYDCRACAEACPDGAIELMPLPDKQLEQMGIARFNEDACIVKVKGTDCAACSEHCPTKAVETIPYGDNLRLPQVNASLCIGCGACQYACPVKDKLPIVVSGLPVHGRAVRTQPKSATDTAPAAPSGSFPF